MPAKLSFAVYSLRGLQGLQSLAYLAKGDEGDTPLHYTIRHAKNVDDVKLFLARNRSAEAMARTINNKGKLPIDLVNEMKLDNDVKQKLRALLTPVATRRFLTKLSDRIECKTVLNDYYFSPNSQIYKNLELACLIGNEVREVMKESSTHPQFEEGEEKQRIREKIKIMRSNSFIDVLALMIFHPITFILDPKNTYFSKKAERPIKNGIGNCGEFTYAAWHFLKEKNKKIPARICDVKNDDHSFLVFGRGNNTVVCDAWAGEVYPFYEISGKLKNLLSYDPKIHSVKSDLDFYSLLKQTNMFYQLLTKSLGLFAPSGVCCFTSLNNKNSNTFLKKDKTIIR